MIGDAALPDDIEWSAKGYPARWPDWLVEDKPTAARPGMRFIRAEDPGCMDIGTNNPRTCCRTPNLAALAAQGTHPTSSLAKRPSHFFKTLG
jgi:hypothetical protein